MENLKHVNLFRKKLNPNIAVSLSPDIYLNCKRRGPTSSEKKLAEKIFLRRIYNGHRTIRECQIPNTRAKFLIVFSPDKTKVACTNGNHNVYVIDTRTKKILKTLSGHKRTPWTVAFHPTNNNILASGCLSGEVRVWNLEDDSFEVWQSPGQTVIASVAFHPKVKLLVIATYRDLYFWDWNTSIILGRASTENEEEKIRYVKFDSTGDKLIAAIALKSSILSSFDSLSFREAYQFTKERDIVKDFRLIQKFCENHLSNLKEFHKNEFVKKSSDLGGTNKMPSLPAFLDHLKLDIVGETMPYMCVHHDNAIHSFLNVGCFCPTEFSINVINMFKKNSLSVEYFSEKCYFCRYTWLYRPVFEFQLVYDSKSHICEKFRLLMNGKHVWKFSEARILELIAENQDVANGLTEETFRYCFEQFARIYIAPFFASIMPNGVCSKCTVFDAPNAQLGANTGGPEARKPFSHDVRLIRLYEFGQASRMQSCKHELIKFLAEKVQKRGIKFRISTFTQVPLRSDCFLNACEMFKFNPTGNFAPSMTAFAEVYQYLSSLQQLSTKEDSSVLILMMTEWEYLYCKLLLINNVIEGDDGLMLRKQFSSLPTEAVNLISKEKIEQRNPCCNLYSNREPDRKRLKLFSSDLFKNPDAQPDERVPGKTASCSENKLLQIIDETAKENESQSSSASDVSKSVGNSSSESTSDKSSCQCREFDEEPEESKSTAMKMLRRELDKLSNAVSRRHDAKIQRHRMEKLYEQQLDVITNRALFKTIQMMKKCIRVHLSYFLIELKKLLKINFSQLNTYDVRFSSLIPRLFMFIVRRAIVFTSSLLEFLCNFKYDIEELTENYSIKTYGIYNCRMLENLLPSRPNFCSLNSEDELIFEEECEPAHSELSDDELSSVGSESVESQSGLLFPGFREEIWNANSLAAAAGEDLYIPLPRKIVASGNYLSKHSKIRSSTPNRSRLRGPTFPLSNVNSILHGHSVEAFSDLRNHSFLHRLQMWDFSNLEIPNISSNIQNTVVTECKVHNDATVAISSDDSRVAVLLTPNQYDAPDWLGVFSIEWRTLGHILCAVSLHQVAVSVSFSPTSQYLAVGYSYSYYVDLKMADVIAVQQEIDSWKDLSTYVRPSPIATSLIELPDYSRARHQTTVNCINWIPVSGQGLVFGNSFGDIKFVF